jgi:hypothetical protein
LLVLGAALLPCILVAQVPRIADIPIGLPALLHQRLTQAAESLIARRNQLVKVAADHNTKCNAVPENTPEWHSCSNEQTNLGAERQQYIDAVNRFNDEVARAISEQGSQADTTLGPQIGAAAECRGGVFIITPGGNKFPVQHGTPIPLNANVTTGPDGHFQILLLDETVFTLGPNSDMILDEYVYDPKTNAGKITASVAKGTFRWVTGKMTHEDPAGSRVKVPVGTIGVRGTDFETEVSPDGSGSVKLFAGQVEINEYKTGDMLVLSPGEMVTFTADGTFSAPGPIPIA